MRARLSILVFSSCVGEFALVFWRCVCVSDKLAAEVEGPVKLLELRNHHLLGERDQQ